MPGSEEALHVVLDGLWGGRAAISTDRVVDHETFAWDWRCSAHVAGSNLRVACCIKQSFWSRTAAGQVLEEIQRKPMNTMEILYE